MPYLLSLYLIAANFSYGGQTLAANRLFELHETQEDNLILSRQLEDLQVGTSVMEEGVDIFVAVLSWILYFLFL
jgi:hypothetical protein